MPFIMTGLIQPTESILIHHEFILIHFASQTFSRSIVWYHDLLRPICIVSLIAANENHGTDGTLLAT